MRRKERAKRFLALLLAFTMIFTSSSMNVLAATIVGGYKNSNKQTEAGDDTQAETQASETQAAETNEDGSEVRQNTVTFATDGHAHIVINGATVDSTANAKDGKIVFDVVVENGYAVESVLVDKSIPARTQEDGSYIIEGILTDETTVDVTTVAVETESESETESETEVDRPAFDFSGTEDGVTATIKADEGVFPAGTKVDLKALTDADREMIAAAAGANSEDVIGLDITFTYEGKEIQPEGNVSVSFAAAEIATAEVDTVYHIDNGAVEEVTASQEGESLGFTSDSFSPFGVVMQSGENIAALAADQKLAVGETTTLSGNGYYGGYNHTWTSSNSAIARVTGNSSKGTVTGVSVGTATITHTYDKWNGTQTDTWNVTVVAKEYTITFDKNGGTGKVPNSMKATAGDEVTMPSSQLSRDGYVFSGWSLINNANADGKYKPGNNGTVYAPGSNFTMPSKDVKLYAVWSRQNVDAEFYIRLDGQIPTEPQGHDASQYTGAIKISKAIKVATFFTDSTNGVESHLNSVPDNSQIKKVMNASNLSYNADTQYILWYVIKSESTWHVDGVLLDKAKVNLVYDPNAPEGTWNNMPDGAQYVKGSQVTVSNKIPTRTGYTFTGWNTKKDGSGTSYTGNSKFTINENTTLYAQWSAGTVSYIVNHYRLDTNGNIADTETENKTGRTGQTVNATPRTYPGYTYQATYDNNGKKTVASGTVVADGSLVLNLYYTKRTDLSYTVNYLEKGTNAVLHEAKTVKNVTFETEITTANEAITIDGYNYDSAEPAEKLVVGTGENVINVYYTKRTDLSYTVNYLEKDTNKVLHDAKVQGGMTFASMVNSADEVITIDGYTYDSTDKDSLTIGTGENVINLYYAKRTDLSYTVKYKDVDTKAEIYADKTAANQTFGTVVNSADEVITIAGYNYNSASAESITVGTGENVLILYYAKKTDLSYTVNYLEKDTNTVLSEQKTVTGKTFQETVAGESEKIDIAGYNYDSVSPVTLTIGADSILNVINVYYTKRTDLSYTVEYREAGTDKELKAAKTVNGQTFGASVTETADEIDGYTVTGESSKSLTIQADEKENKIIFYYTKRGDLAYVVNYLEKGTDKVLHEAKTADKQTFDAEITASAEKIDIDGYNYDSVDPETLKIKTDNSQNVINVYYTKRTDLSYTVNYLEKGTNAVLHEAKTVENVTFETEITTANEAIAIDGYNYDSAEPAEKLVVGTGENVINVYYTKRTDLSYTVNYLEKDTNKVLHDAKVQGGMTFASMVNSADEVITIDGYTYDSTDKDSLTIGTGENVINLYYAKRTDLSYTVKYKDVDTKAEIYADKTAANQTFGTVVNSADEVITIAGYNYNSASAESITVGTGENVLILYYAKKTDLSYTVNYLEKDTNTVLSEQKTVTGKTFQETVAGESEKIDIAGYNYDSVSPVTLTIGADSILNVINVYYTKRTDLSYTVEYREAGTDKELKAAKTVNGQTFGASVTETADEIDGYTVTGESSKSLTIQADEKENKIIFYYTKRGDLAYVVNYLEKGTDKVLHEAKTADKQTFDAEITASAEKIDIDGYNYDSVDPETLKIKTDNSQNVINVYYTKRTDLSYTVNYLEKGTNAVLHEAKTVENVTFETEITTANEAIAIDGYNYDSAEPAEKLVVGTGENVINVYYTKRTDLSYTVNYLEKDTNKVLHDAKVQGGMTFASMVNSADEVITIDGYTYDSTDKDSLTIGTGENVINLYYAKRTDLSYTVKYKDVDTKAEIYADKTAANQTFGTVVNSADEVITIAGYNYNSASAESITVGTGENVLILYYAKKTDLSYTVNYLEKDTNTVLSEQKTVTGKTFQETVAGESEKIDIAGYNYDSVSPVTLTIGADSILNVINVYYTKRTDLSYTVEYREAGTDKELKAAKTVNGQTFGASVTETADEIDGYTVTGESSKSLTIQADEKENKIIFYYTKRGDLAYVVNYLEKGTDKVLHEAKTADKQTFDAEITASAEKIDIDGYNYDSVDPETLKIKTDNSQNVINVYYTKRTDLSYTVNYLEKGTNAVLHEAKTVENVTFETEITTANEAIAIDGYNYDSVAPAEKLVVGTGENVINVYYTKRTDLSYTVNYLEKDTNKVLHDAKVQGGMTFASTVNSANEVIEIHGYKYESADPEELLINTQRNVMNLYYLPDSDQTVHITYKSMNTNAGKVTNEADDIQIVTADGLKGSVANANEGYAFAGWYKGTELVSSATNLDITTAKAHLNKAEDGTYVATEFVAHWKGLEVTKVVNSIVDKDGNKQKLDEAVSLNDTITYKITVKNIGTVDLTDIEVSDELADAQLVSGSSWTIQSLAAGTTSDPIYVTYTVKETDLGKALKNVATATVPKDPEVPVKPGETTNETDDVNPSLAAEKTIVSTQESYGVDDEVLFNITVTNNGNVTLTNVIVSELLSGAEIVEGTGYDLTNEGTAKITTLAPGEVVTVNASYVVRQDDVDNGNLKNTALVEGEGPDGNNPEPQRPEKDVPMDEKAPQMTAVKSVTNQGTAENGKFKVGETAKFEIAVTNQGNVTLKNVTVTENLENAIIDEDPANYTVANNVATIASILPGKTIIVKAYYVVAQEDIDRGTLNNIATVTAPGTDPKTPSEPVPMEDQKSSYTVVKTLTNLEEATGTRTAEDGTETKAFKAGETAKFDITVKNTGNVTLTDIKVTDILQGATLLKGTGYTLENATTAVITKLAPTDEAVVIKAEYVVTQTDVESGGTENLATSTAKGPGDPEKPTPVDPDLVKPAPVPTEDPAPAVAITKETTSKSADAAGYAEDETITYDIQATNTGNVTLHDVVITDQKTGDTWNIETLVPNASTDVYKASYKVTQADILVGEVENTAVVVGTPARAEKEAEVAAQAFEEVVPDNTVTDSASVTDPTVKPSSALKVTKTVTSKGSAITIDGKDVNGYRVGDTIEFNIHVENTGNITLNNIVVNDVPTLDAGSPKGSITIAASADGKYTVDGSTATIATLAPKASVDIKASYLVMAGDGTVKGNKLFNTAFATGISEDPNNPQPGDSSKTDPVPIEPEPDDGNGAMEGSITVTKMITTSDGKTPTSGVNAAIKVGLYDNASFSGTPIAVNTITISNATSGNTVFNELDNTANTTYYVAELDTNNQPIVAANAHLEGYGAPAYSDNCKKGINPTTATDTAATIINPLKGGLEETEDTTEKTTEKSSTTSDSSTSTKSSTAAKTGDDTNMMIYWLLLGMAVLAGCTAVVYRKRKER